MACHIIWVLCCAWSGVCCAAGLSQADILSAASQVQLRPGCITALAAAAAAGAEVQVVSVNWSSQLVAAALQGAAGAGR